MNRTRVSARLVAALAFVLVGVAALAASASAGGARSSQGGIIIDGTTDTVTNIDPAANYDFGSGTVDSQIFQHLLETEPGKSVPQPVLATRCAFVGDLKTYRCTLRKGVTFQNGSGFTSADVKYSFDRVVKIEDPSGIYRLLDNLKSVSVSGPYAVTFHLKTPQSTWPLILTTGAGQIVAKDVYPAGKAQPNSSPQVGTGPYMLSSYTPGQQVVLKTWSGYWGPRPRNSEVVIRYYATSSTMKLALEKDDIDMAFRTFTPAELSSLATETGIKVHKGQGAEIRFLVFNVKRGPFESIAVRRAVAYLMPRQALAARVYHGDVEPLYSMVPSGLLGHTDAFAAVYGRSPNVTAAKKVLARAGVNTPVAITLWYTPSHYGGASAAEYAEIQRALNASGLFEVSLRKAAWPQYVNTLGHAYDAFQLGLFPDYIDAEDYIVPFYGKGNFTSNGYDNPRLDALIAKERATKSTFVRLRYLRQAQAIAAKNVPIIPYWQGKMIAVAHTNVHGIDRTLDPSYTMRFWLLSKS